MKKYLNLRLTAYMALTVAVSMVITTIFLLCGTAASYLRDFRSDVYQVFTGEFLGVLQQDAVADPATASRSLMQAILEEGSALQLGGGRQLFLLSADGTYLAGTNDDWGMQLEQDGNIYAAMNGEVGDNLSVFGSQLDIAIPIQGEGSYIAVLADSRSSLREQFSTLGAMLFGAFLCSLLGALAFGWLLMKTVTDPVKHLLVRVTEGIALPEKNQFEDELGQLTRAVEELLPPAKPRSEGAGRIVLTREGVVLQMDEQAEALTGTRFREDLRLEELFDSTPMPGGGEDMALHAVTPQGGRMLDLQTEASDEETLTLVVQAAKELTV